MKNVILVYYLYLLPLLAWVTIAFIHVFVIGLQPGEPEPGWDMLLLLLPIINGMAYLGLLASNELPLALPILAFWAFAGVPVFAALNLARREKVRKAREKVRKAEEKRMELLR